MKHPRYYYITAKIRYDTPVEFYKTDPKRAAEPRFIAFKQHSVVAHDEAEARQRFLDEQGSYGEQSISILTVQPGDYYGRHASLVRTA
jgi:hypothetical protein